MNWIFYEPIADFGSMLFLVYFETKLQMNLKIDIWGYLMSEILSQKQDLK